MSINLGALNSILLQQHFGDNVQKVGDCLLSAVQSRTLANIVKTTGLLKTEVAHALAVLIKFRLVKFAPSSNGGASVEYSIKSDKVYLLVRYPKYVQYIRSKYGELAGLLINELLRVGSDIASNLIIRCSTSEIAHDKIVQLKDEFLHLIQLKYLMRAPVLVTPSANEPGQATLVPEFDIEEHTFFTEPQIDLQELVRRKNGESIEPSDSQIYWFVNIDRLHQEFRDLIMISAMHRSVDENAAQCLQCILHLMYARTDAWQAVTNPISFAEMRHLIEKTDTLKVNPALLKQLDQYIAVICDDKMEFLSKFGDAGGGQYVVRMRHAIEQLTWACIENIIIEKFGKKAARIFRIVRIQKYCDQDDIQKEAMIPSKEAKLFTYKLLEENYFQIKTIRKSGTGGGGMAKSFCLFHVNQSQIVSMLLEHCYKSMFNCITRANHIKTENGRIIDKSQRLEVIVQTMKERGQPEEYINEIYETITPPEKELLENITARCKNLVCAEIGLDETIFLLQLYQDYQHLK